MSSTQDFSRIPPKKRKVVIVIELYLNRLDSIHAFPNDVKMMAFVKGKRPVRLTWAMGEQLKRDLKAGKVCEVPLLPEPKKLVIQTFRI